MQTGDTLRGRYRLESVLGRGASGTTWLAEAPAADPESGKPSGKREVRRVVVKAITLAGLREWSDLEALEREARVLASIHHPRVPRLVDSFSTEEAGGPCFVLVQQYLPGTTLEQKVAGGWRGTEEEIVRIAVGLLRIVADMHALRPPVIHRDISPKNVILGEDGEVSLVDFGGVLDLVRRDSPGSPTVTGTAGYAPLEQWSGNATERSDLYACGATVLFLLTHVNPAELPTREMRVDYRSVLQVSPALGWVLDRLLEPDEAKRTVDPAQAIRVLERGEPPVSEERADETPFGSRIRLSREGGALELVVPERGSARAGATLLGFAAVWLTFIAFWTGMSMAMGAPIVFPLFSVPFWVVGVAMLRKGIGSFLGSTRIRIDGSNLEIRRRVVLPGRTAVVPLRAVGSVAIEKAGSWQVNTRSARTGPSRVVRIQAGAKAFSFGEYLADPERTWVRDTLRAELGRRRA